MGKNALQWDRFNYDKTPLFHSLEDASSIVGWANHQTSPEKIDQPNPLMAMPHQPLPPSCLELLEEYTKSVLPKTSKDTKDLFEIDISGRVALGVVVENALVASFLSLAHQHVKRCRSIPIHDSFDEWAIPPEEAILKLLDDLENQDDEFDIEEWCQSLGI
mmetsp:Transcript_32944/g.46800  ORF Transcript_32944/g.46800 Transcript_32944/m.46800 type:complete len:161 (+) Transcript_32944:71-553(+)